MAWALRVSRSLSLMFEAIFTGGLLLLAVIGGPLRSRSRIRAATTTRPSALTGLSATVKPPCRTASSSDVCATAVGHEAVSVARSDRRRGSLSSGQEENVASYPASQQIPWLGERYAAALAAWERNPTDTVRRLEMSMIAVVMISLTIEQSCWVADRDMPWPNPTDADPTPSRRRL
jgi:hypothetical protein